MNRHVAVLAAAALLAFGCAAQPEERSSDQDATGTGTIAPASVELEPRAGFALEAEIAGGGARRYRVPLDAGSYLHLVVAQVGVDVVVTLAAPDGSPLLTADTPRGREGEEQIFFLARSAGLYELEIRAFEGAIPGSRYRLRIDAVGEPSALDRSRATAARAASDARTKSADDAARLHLEAARLWRETGDREPLAWSLYRLGLIWSDDAAHRQASVAVLDEALSLFEVLGYRWQQALMLERLGDVHAKTAAWSLARRHYDRALAIWRELEARKEEANALSELGLVAKRRGRIRSALALYEEANDVRDRYQVDDRRNRAVTRNNLGVLLRQSGEHRRALDEHRAARALLDADNEPQLMAETLVHVGDALFELGSLDEALVQHRSALELADRRGLWHEKARALNSIGNVQQRRGESAAALESYEEALALLRGYGEPIDRLVALFNLGITQERLGHVDRARELFAETLSLSRTVADRQTEASALFAFARLARRDDRLAEARALVESSLEIVESVRGDTPGSELRSLYLATKQLYFDFLVEVLALMHRRDPGAGFDIAAFEAGERARARSLLDAFSEVRGHLAGSTPDLARLDELREQADSDDAREELRDLEARIRRRHPEWLELGESRALPLGEIRRRLLDRETLLLEYYLADEKSFVWAVTADGLELFELDGREEIRTAALRAYDALARSHRFTEVGRSRLATADLAAKVLAPVAGLLDRPRIVVVAPDALQYVPFAALPKPAPSSSDGTGRPLVADHEIVSLPSASVGTLLRVRLAGRPAATGALAVFADPVLTADDERLPWPVRAPADAGAEYPPDLRRLLYSRQEAVDLLALAGDGTLAAFGFDATRELALGGRLGDYRILHFATHSVLDTERPERSTIVLTRYRPDGTAIDGDLRAHEILGLGLSADLVVLSSCQTALGSEIRGEGLVGWARAFLDAGAAQVVASLWPVSDRATAELMRRFYEGLLDEGLPPAAALRRAQADMSRDATWHPPYFWAGFVLLGDWSRDAVARPPSLPSS